MADTYQPFIPDNGEERPQSRGFQSLWPGRIKTIGSFSESSESAKRKKKKRNVVLRRFITVWFCIIAFICLNVWAGWHFGAEILLGMRTNRTRWKRAGRDERHKGSNPLLPSQ